MPVSYWSAPISGRRTALRSSPDAGTPTFSDSQMPGRLTIDFGGVRRANKAGAFGVYQRAPRLAATRFTIETERIEE
jgi:hypothetical protein